jgi:hypothetical protein
MYRRLLHRLMAEAVTVAEGTSSSSSSGITGDSSSQRLLQAQRQFHTDIKRYQPLFAQVTCSIAYFNIYYSTLGCAAQCYYISLNMILGDVMCTIVCNCVVVLRLVRCCDSYAVHSKANSIGTYAFYLQGYHLLPCAVSDVVMLSIVA